MHGGKAVSPPIVHGRYARYHRIFGDGFLALLRDPELLASSVEIALHDQYMLERAAGIKEGWSGPWLLQLRRVANELDAAIKAGDTAMMREHLTKLLRMIEEGADHQKAWEDLLGAAKQRADIATKADAIVARREQTVTESHVLGLIVRMLTWIVEEAGAEIGQRIRSRFEVEVLGKIQQPKELKAG